MFEQLNNLPETLVKSRAVAQEGGQASFKDETEVHGPVRHTLVDERVSAGLGNDQIGPLDNDNSDKVSGLASVLKNLAVVIGPFLTIRVDKVVDRSRVPFGTLKMVN